MRGKTKLRTLFVLLAVLLLSSAMGTAALAEDNTPSIMVGGQELTAAESNTYWINAGGTRLSSNGASSTNYNLCCSVNPYSETPSVTLYLRGLKLDNYQTQHGIYVKNVKDVRIIVESANDSVIKGTGAVENDSYGIYVENGNLLIEAKQEGVGALKASGRQSNNGNSAGIRAENNVPLSASYISIITGTLEATGGTAMMGRSCGIWAENITLGSDYESLGNRSLDIKAAGGLSGVGSYGLYADGAGYGAGQVEVKKRHAQAAKSTGITATGGTVRADNVPSMKAEGSFGIYGIQNVPIGDGTVKAVGGSATGTQNTETYFGSYGIYVPSDSRNNITITGGTVTANTSQTTGTTARAMSKAPVLSGYTPEKYKVTASTKGDGRDPETDYVPGNMSSYKYFNIRPIDGYLIWVNGVQVKDANKGDVLGDGTVSFTPADETNLDSINTLTLSGATLKSAVDLMEANPIAGTSGLAGIYFEENLKIVLSGDNTVDLSSCQWAAMSCGIYTNTALLIEGGGTLYVTGGQAGTGGSYGIKADALAIDNCSVTAAGGSAGNAAITDKGDSCGLWANQIMMIGTQNKKTTVSATGGEAAKNSYGLRGTTVAIGKEENESFNDDVTVTAMSTDEKGAGICVETSGYVSSGSVTVTGKKQAFEGHGLSRGIDGDSAHVATAASARMDGSELGEYVTGSIAGYRYVRFEPAVDYPVWVDGTHVTSANRYNVLTGANAGKAAYIPAGETGEGMPARLILKGAQTENGHSVDAGGNVKAGIYAEEALEILLEDLTETRINRETPDQNDKYNSLGIYVKGHDLTINGRGLLDVYGNTAITTNVDEHCVAILADSVTINSGRINAYAAGASQLSAAIYAIEGGVTINDGEIKAESQGAYVTEYGIYSRTGVTINGGHVDALLTDPGSVQHAPICYGIYTDGKIKINSGRFTATNHVGGARIAQAVSTAPDTSGYEPEADAQVTASPNADGSDPVAEYMPYDIKKYRFLRIGPSIPTDIIEYKIWIDGVQITSQNKDDVLAGTENWGTVSFTPAADGKPPRLTLSGVTLTSRKAGYGMGEWPQLAGIYSAGQPNLEIELAEGTVNVITGASEAKDPSDMPDEQFVPGIQVYQQSQPGYGTLTILGEGTLISRGGTAVATDDAGQNKLVSVGASIAVLHIKSGTVILEASVTPGSKKSYGFFSTNGSIIDGGSLTVINKNTSGYACGLANFSGLLQINGGSVTLAAGKAMDYAISEKEGALKPVIAGAYADGGYSAVISTNIDGTDPQPYADQELDGYKYFKIEPDNYGITVETAAGGTVTSSHTRANAGETVTLTAVPDKNLELESLTVTKANGGGSITPALGDDGKYTFDMPGCDVTVTPVWRDITLSHTITAAAYTGGTINPSGNVSVKEGEDKTFTITPNQGYEIEDVLVDNKSVKAALVSQTGSWTYSFTDVQEDHNIFVIFKLSGTTSHTITASAGENGSITPAGALSVSNGADKTFTITPNQGYEIEDVLVDSRSVKGDLVSQTGSWTYSFTDVQRDHEIYVTFKLSGTVSHTITASAGENGSITPAGVLSVSNGADKAFTITPNQGYAVDQVLVDGVNVGARVSYIFQNVSGDHTIHVTFKASGGVVPPPSGPPSESEYTITATAYTGGGISPAGNVSVKAGGSKTFAVTPNEGYVIEDVLVDGKSVGAVSEYTFKGVSADHTIRAVFKTVGGNHGYTDVDDDDWFKDDVDYVDKNGIMNGIGGGLFDPYGKVSRAMLVTTIWRLEGSPQAGEDGVFTDVPAGEWYTRAVNWAADKAIVLGYGNGLFGPNDPLTREQMVTMLYRYAVYKGRDVSVGEDTNILSYLDAFHVSEWAVSPFQWACGSGIIKGSGNLLTPKAGAIRAELAAVLHRFMELK